MKEMLSVNVPETKKEKSEPTVDPVVFSEILKLVRESLDYAPELDVKTIKKVQERINDKLREIEEDPKLIFPDKKRAILDALEKLGNEKEKFFSPKESNSVDAIVAIIRRREGAGMEEITNADELEILGRKMKKEEFLKTSLGLRVEAGEITRSVDDLDKNKIYDEDGKMDLKAQVIEQQLRNILYGKNINETIEKYQSNADPDIRQEISNLKASKELLEHYWNEVFKKIEV